MRRQSLSSDTAKGLISSFYTPKCKRDPRLVAADQKDNQQQRSRHTHQPGDEVTDASRWIRDHVEQLEFVFSLFGRIQVVHSRLLFFRFLTRSADGGP